MPPCPDENTLVQYTAGQLPVGKQEEVHRHIDECPSCLALLVDLTSTAGESSPPGTQPAAAAEWTPPPQIEEYSLLRPLGRGAMGQVFRGHDLRLDRPVAVKFPAPHTSAAALAHSERERFVIEARAIARLSHPNVVAIYRVGEIDGHPYLVSEYVRGASLNRLTTPLPWPQVVKLGIDLSRGLAAAHRRGVLHRDIKPANAILTPEGDVKLLDFGLAKLMEGPIDPGVSRSLPGIGAITLGEGELTKSPELTRTGNAIGTPLYMAPESWAGQPATARSDLYSLGAVLYELASGAPPHEESTLAALKLAVCSRDAVPLSQRAPTVEPRLAAIIDRCLRRDPQERPASADELRQALEPLVAKRPPRFRQPLAVALFVMVGVAAAIISFREQSRQGERHRQQEAALLQRAEEASQRADEASREELGRQAVELARLPGKERTALSAAIQAAGQDLNAGRTPSAQAVRGLFAAVGMRAFLTPTRAAMTWGRMHEQINAASFSPDGQQVLVASGSQASLWEAASGRKLLALSGPDEEILTAVFSPDGRQILTTSAKQVRLWDARTAKMLQTFSAPNHLDLEAPFSPDGKRLLTASTDGKARIFNSETGALLATLVGHDGAVVDARMSADGKLILTASEDGTARLWDAQTGRPQGLVLQHGQPLELARFSSAGTRILTESIDHDRKLWDSRTGQQVTAASAGNHDLETGLRTLDGRYVLATHDRGIASLWDRQRERVIATLLYPTTEVIRFAAMAADEERFLTAGRFLITLWKAPARRSLPADAPSPAAMLTCQRMATREHPSRLWDSAKGQPIAYLDLYSKVTATAFSSDCRWLITGHENATLALWDAHSGQQLESWSGNAGVPRRVVFSPDGRHAAAYSEDATVGVWNVPSGRLVGVLSGLSPAIEAISFSSLASELVVVDAAGIARSISLDPQELFARACQLLDYGLQDSEVSAQCRPLAPQLADAERGHIAGVDRRERPPAAAPANLDLEDSPAGTVPTGWQLTGYHRAGHYQADTVEEQCASGKRCARLRSSYERLPYQSEFGTLMQTIDARPYRNKQVSLRVLVRAEVVNPPGRSRIWQQNRAQAWLRVDRPGRSFLENMTNRPILSREWKEYEIVAPVAKDAETVNFGYMLLGHGVAWMDAVRLEVIGAAPPPPPG